MGHYVHFSVCYSSDLDKKAELEKLVNRFQAPPDIPIEADMLLQAILDPKNYNCGRKGELFTWGIVGNYTSAESIVQLLAPFFEEQLRRELGPLDFDHIIIFEEHEQTEQAQCWEIYLEGNENGKLVIKHHMLPFCWGADVMYAIFDLDGTLADDRRRKPLIDFTAPEPWAAYHEACGEDPLINEQLMKIAQGLEPIIFTSRPESVRGKTERWLRTVAKLDVQRLFMRPMNCRKSSPSLKADFLEALFRQGITPRDIVCAFDDRPDVLAIYELYGLPTMHVVYPTEVKRNESHQ